MQLIISILNDDKQNYHFCILKLLIKVWILLVWNLSIKYKTFSRQLLKDGAHKTFKYQSNIHSLPWKFFLSLYYTSGYAPWGLRREELNSNGKFKKKVFKNCAISMLRKSLYEYYKNFVISLGRVVVTPPK